MGALYKIDFPNGKSYVGITCSTAAARFNAHVKESRNRRGWALHRALAKYGAGGATLTTLAIADDGGYLQLVERNAIRVFGTFGRGGYNMTAGGDGFRGTHTPEAKAKIGLAARNCSAETREKIGAASRGRPGATLGVKHSAAACAAKSMRQLTAMPRSVKNTSGYTGVYWNKAAKKWQAYFKVAGKVQYVGVFADKLDAYEARTAAIAAYLSAGGGTP